MKVRPLIVLALALFLALAAVYFARLWLLGQAGNSSASVNQAQLVKVVAAATSLKFGDRLVAENLRLTDWPAGSVPEGTFKSIDELLGPQPRVALQAIQPNELILINKVTGPGQRASLSAVISTGMRAMTIRVNDVLGVAGFVLPGDRVDVALTRQKDNNGKERSSTQVVLQNMRVLAIDQTADERNEKPSVVKAVTLEVDTPSAQKLALAASVGNLSLMLRKAGEGSSEQTRALTLVDLSGLDVAGTQESLIATIKVHRPSKDRMISEDYSVPAEAGGA